MRILGIESSSLVASVAIVEDDITMAEFTADFKKTHSQTLLPMIDDMAKLLGIELSTVDALFPLDNGFEYDPRKNLH